MTDMQKKLLEMFTWLINYLKINNIRYYVIGGTFLGAVRHEGFIPWDDDIDIGVPRSDYEKLLASFKEPIDNYIIESPHNCCGDYPYSYAKLYDLNTTLVEDIKKPLVRGIFIDIFPLDGIGNSYEEGIKNYKSIDKNNILQAMKASKVRKDRKLWKNIAVVLGLFIPVSVPKLIKKIDNLCKLNDFDKCEYVGNLMSTYRSREIMEKRIFGKPTLYKFEGLDVFGPENYDEYLTILYNDWKKMPPENKRKTAHDFIFIDYHMPYKEYGKK